MPRSRINHKLEKETKRNILLIAGGILFLILLALTIGTNLLVNFSLFVERKSDSTESQSSSQAIVATPSLDPLSKATNSALLSVTGSSYSGKNVRLYLNGKAVDTEKISSDGSFQFNDIELEEGENMIKVKAITEDKIESKFSETNTIIFTTEVPLIEIIAPRDGESVNKDRNPLSIEGTVSIDAEVTINGFNARVDDQGNFNYKLPLRNGENTIKIKAITDAGNLSEKEIKISYSE